MFASGCEATIDEIWSLSHASEPSDPSSAIHTVATQAKKKIQKYKKNFTSNQSVDIHQAANYWRPCQEKPGIIAAETQGRVQKKQSET